MILLHNMHVRTLSFELFNEASDNTKDESNPKKLESGKYIDKEKEKEYELCKNCAKCYVSKSCKALLTIGRDTTTGKTIRKTFSAETEEKALADALQYKLDIDKNGGPRIITKSNKTLVELITTCINEAYKLKKIDQSTYKRKMDTLKKISKAPFANKAISKATRDEVVNYLSSLSKYSESTVKQNYELLCMGFGEALILDYKKDIILSKNKVEIRRTQTKDDKGNIIIGDTTKTDNGRRTKRNI